MTHTGAEATFLSKLVLLPRSAQLLITFIMADAGDLSSIGD